MTLEREEKEYRPRDPNDIDLESFDPIWLPEQEFSGEIPKDLLEVVGSGLGIQAVDIIDDPTRKLDDCLEVVPFGTNMTGFLITRYVEQKLLPVSLEDKLLGYDYSPPPPSPPTHKSSLRTENALRHDWNPTTTDLDTLSPWAVMKVFPPSIEVLRVPNEKDDNAWARKAQDLHPGFLQQTGLLFRGVPLKGLERSLSLFLSTFNETSHQHEFGPALYVTPCLMCAKRYAGPGGAIMVFRHEDTEKLEVWHPSLDEWKLMVVHRLGLQVLHRAEVTAKFRAANVIIGPMSKRLRIKTNDDIKQTDRIQYAYRAYSSLECLASSLIGIIYIG